MTTIAAATDGTTVWMAADSCSSNSPAFVVRHRTDPKLVRLPVGDRHALLGFAGLVQVERIARYHLDTPTVPDPNADSELAAWAHQVAERWGQLAVDHRAVDADGDVDGIGLLGYAGRLWSITDGCALRIGHYYAIGTGGPYAMGALAALGQEHRGIRLPEDLTAAVEAAARHDLYTRPPVVTDRASTALATR